ncbi:MAG: reverse transcriptase-like protein [Lachnospiraceae bacterium]|nr:reverse transcriptase-like protein [Lachnospiraceae bacterium]
MAEKKYYAVRKGKKTGIFKSWAECKASVDGYSGAEYKGFVLLEETEAYLGITMKDQVPGAAENAVDENRQEVPKPGTLLAYVDGSYDDSLKKYAFGCVFIMPDGSVETEYGNGDNAQSLQHRNVTGEMLGAMYAVKVAIMSGFARIEICYDYQGIEKWVTGEWRSKTELTRKYANAMREWGKEIEICFTKVAAHSNVYYNELADKMAKTGLREGNGIPRVRSVPKGQ